MTPDRVTPEQAQKMLDRVKEGCPLPWEIYTTETLESDPREVKNVRYSDPVYDGHLAYSMDYDGTTEIDPDAIELIAAAPELAEIVAGLRYEYAVQEFVGYWRERGGEFPNVVEARRFLDMKQEDAPMRIVRRLVSDVEVVE